MISVMALASSTRRVSTLFLSVALLFAGALGWLGWRLIQQDRALARQRRVERLEAAADRVSAAMYRRLGKLEEALADPEHRPLSSDAVLLRAGRDGVVVRPADGSLYLPIVPVSPEPPPSIFVDGEALEFQKNDPAAAVAAFRRLTGSTDPPTRAGALLRLGRSLAKSDSSWLSMAAVRFQRLSTPLMTVSWAGRLMEDNCSSPATARVPGVSGRGVGAGELPARAEQAKVVRRCLRKRRGHGWPSLVRLVLCPVSGWRRSPALLSL